jgi:hypothetical protein
MEGNVNERFKANSVDQCASEIRRGAFDKPKDEGEPMADLSTRPNRDQLSPCPEVHRSAHS